MPKEKTSCPYLSVALEVVTHELQQAGGISGLGPSTLLVEYSNDGNLPSYGAYLVTYSWQQDAETSTWKYSVYKKEIMTIQPGSRGSFEYPLGPPLMTAPQPPEVKPSPVVSATPTGAGPPITYKYKMVSMIFDPISDPLPKPADEYFASPYVDRHVACSSELLLTLAL